MEMNRISKVGAGKRGKGPRIIGQGLEAFEEREKERGIELPVLRVNCCNLPN